MSVISRISLQEMIAEVRRELLQRAVVYGRLLAKGEMEADVAKRRNTCMNAVLATLEHLREIERAKSPDAFVACDQCDPARDCKQRGRCIFGNRPVAILPAKGV